MNAILIPIKNGCYFVLVVVNQFFLKQGGVKKPHFAHFQERYSDKVEPCELRASSYGNISQINSFIQDRGQRLKIFQQHFLNLISFDGDKPTTNLDFNNWINSIKRDHNTVIDIIASDCTDYFKRYCHQIAAKYIKPITNNDNKPVLIQQEIALEAISYLCVKSSCNLLEYLLCYGTYKLYELKQNKLFKQDITTKDIPNICNLVIKIIIFNNWLEAFNYIKINNIESETKTKLPSQAYNVLTGKSRDHNSVSGYAGSKPTKTKMSTGVKLTSGIQKGINTNLFSNLFKLVGCDRPMQVELSKLGNIYLNQYLSDGQKIQTSIGKISHRDDKGRYQIAYATGYKLHDNVQIDKHIQRLIEKAIHHDTSILKSQPTILEQPKRLSKCRRKAIAKQLAATTAINNGKIVNLVTQNRDIDNTAKIELAKMLKAKKQEMYDRKHGRIV